jgi:hypothetical protein
MKEKRKSMIWIKLSTLVITIGLVVYFLIMTVIIPVSRFKIEIDKEKSSKKKNLQSDLNFQLSVEDSLKNKAIDVLNRKAFLLSKLEMTKIDSISLAINLRDSIAELVIQGVTIYSAKIQDFSVTNVFSKTDPFILAEWLSTPFTVTTRSASIPQVPVLYKKAPKDTIEAMSQLELDPLKDDIDPVNFVLNLDRKLNLYFEQAEKPEKGTRRQLTAYKRQVRAMDFREILNHLIWFKPIEFVPKITIIIDKKAARVIYRALPVDALVAVQLSPEHYNSNHKTQRSKKSEDVITKDKPETKKAKSEPRKTNKGETLPVKSKSESKPFKGK